MDIPNVGIFHVKNGLAGVLFSDILRNDVRDVLTKPFCERKFKE